MEKKKDELLNFAFNEQDEKIKFYRETLVQMTKGLIGYTPMHKLAEDAGKITEEIMKKVDKFEQEKTNMWSPNYDPSYNMTTTIVDHLGFEGNKQKVNPDFLKTESMGTSKKEKDKNLKPFLDEYDSKHFELKFQDSMGTIVDNGPQYKTEKKGIYELTNQDVDFITSEFKTLNSIISNIEMPSNKYKDVLRILVDVPRFIYSKSCEKCEE